MVWHGYELRPPGAPPLPDFYIERIKASRPQLETIARQHYGLNIDSGPFGISSRPALIGSKFAESQGLGDAYHAAVFQAYWQHALSIEDEDTLLGIAKSVGLDHSRFAAALNDPAYESALLADVAEAAEIGLQGVPALIFAGRFLVSGAQPYDKLAGIADQIQARLGL